MLAIHNFSELKILANNTKIRSSLKFLLIWYHNDLTCIFLLRGSFKMEVCKVFWSRHSMTSSAVVCLDREAPRDFFTEWVSTAFIPQSIGLKSTAAILLNILFMIQVVYVQSIVQGCNNDYHGFHMRVIERESETEREMVWEDRLWGFQSCMFALLKLSKDC